MGRARAVDLAFVLVCATLIATIVWSFRSTDGVPQAQSLPTPEEMDSLSRYLTPVGPAPRLDDYGAFLPARRAPVGQPDAAPIATAPEEEDPSTWQLSAILIAGTRPVAIINDQAVSAGARLTDGTVVLEIERDHVVIRAPNGTRRRLVLTAG